MTAHTFESLTQAADRTGISRRTLLRCIAHGELQAYMLGRRILRVRPEEVDALLRPRSSGADLIRVR